MAMGDVPGLPRGHIARSAAQDLAERLERGEVIHYPVCPFPLPEGDDRRFLLEQHLGSRAHKNISFNPHNGKTAGFWHRSIDQAERLCQLLAKFSREVTAWLAEVLPDYALAWQLDQVSYRPVEEATRKLRLTARNDLLHLDAFPSRPTNGYRILRVFANVNLTEPRVWVTSEPFAKLLARYGAEVGLPGKNGPGLLGALQHGMVRLFRPGRRRRSAYDSFMLRFHNFLKSNEPFQEHGPRRFWHFQPGSAWMAITDTASHAALRGRFALEHSYFIAPQTLALPEEAPAALLERVCGFQVLNPAA
jgi:hypothetical protein